jgi:phage tail-like protein
VRRRRLPSRGAKRNQLAKVASTSDYRFLEDIVRIQFPIRAAETYLRRNMANRVSYRLVEARRGETPGMVRGVEVRHENSGERTWVYGNRVLANGQPASFFVPDHLVRIEPAVEGAAARTRVLSQGDELVLHVPVRGYLRYLPGIFRGNGPVTRREVLRVRDAAVVRWGGAPREKTRILETDEDPIRRFLFLFQHLMTSVTEHIDGIPDITDPLLCNPRFLPWLASWVGFELDEALPIHQQRELVRRAIRLFRSRGTRHGMEEMVRVLTSAPVKVQERVVPNAAVLGKMNLVGGRDIVERYRRSEPGGSFLMAPEARSNTSYFKLILEPRDRFHGRFGERSSGVLRRIVQIVSQERPTHVVFTIEFDVRKK